MFEIVFLAFQMFNAVYFYGSKVSSSNGDGIEHRDSKNSVAIWLLTRNSSFSLIFVLILRVGNFPFDKVANRADV